MLEDRLIGGKEEARKKIIYNFISFKAFTTAMAKWASARKARKTTLDDAQ